jgi:DNA polymerase-3 subunit alpha
MDFLNRIDIKAVGKSVIERLIQTGAFDRLGTANQRQRETLLGNFERAVEYAQNIKDDKKFGQASLFGETGEKEYPDFEFEAFPDSGRAEKLKTEKELIGFYFSGHPMDEYREIWQKTVKVDLSRPESLVPGTQILAGLVKNVKPKPTKSGEKMAFATLQDYNGEIELTFFPSAWKKCQDKIEEEKVTILKGKIEHQKDRDKYSFTVDEYLEADEAEKAIRDEEAQSRKWDKYRNIWKYAKDLELRFLDTTAAARAEPGTYTVIGVIKSLRTHIDSKGKEMAFVTMQDQRGEIDLVFFARTWENCKAIVAVDETLA